MTTETHKIDRAAETTIALNDGAVARIVHKDGSSFAGRAAVMMDEGALIVAYADGTSVALTL